MTNEFVQSLAAKFQRINVFLSFELRCQKPDSKIYDLVSEKLPFEGKDILFIDDDERNICEAKRHGWNTLLATGLELDNIIGACEEFIS